MKKLLITFFGFAIVLSSFSFISAQETMNTYENQNIQHERPPAIITCCITGEGAAIHLENYLTVVEQGKLGVAFLNSMLYATGATLLVVVFSTSAAFVLSRNRSRRNRFLYFFSSYGLIQKIKWTRHIFINDIIEFYIVII